MSLINSIVAFNSGHYHPEKCTMSPIFMRNHIRFSITSRLALNIIICWHIQAIACLQFSIKEVSLERQWVLVTIPWEEIQWRSFRSKLRHNTHIYTLSENWWDKLEMFFTFEKAYVSLFCQSLRSSLKIWPLSKHSFMFSKDFI